MRWRLLMLGMIFVSGPVGAQDAQQELDALLRDTPAERIRAMRATCAVGEAVKSRARLSAAGFTTSSAAAWCVTVLTRAGRDRTLGFVRDPRSSEQTSALAFDNGFVGGYLKREALPADAPAMAALLPVAERCLGKTEPDTDLCMAAGQMLGTRAARGEVITLR